MDEIKRGRGRPKKIKTCPEGKELNPVSKRCRKIKEPKEAKKRGRPPKEPKPPKEAKKRGRPPKSKDEVPKENKKSLPKIKNSSVVPPAPSIPISVLSPSVVPNIPAPPPSETPPPVLPLNSSNYKKRIEKRKYNKPVKVIKQKEKVPIPLDNVFNKEELIKKGKEILNKYKKDKLSNIIPPSFTSLPSLDINEMSKINPKPTFNKLQNKIMDSSSRKRNMLDKMYMGNEIKSANTIQKVFRGHQVRKDIVIV